MKGKSIFTRVEADKIIALIRLKLKADTNTQKGIRNKIRDLGFYATDFGIGGGYTEHDFLRVITIKDEKNITNSTQQDPKNLTKTEIIKKANEKPIKKRDKSDEAYIIDLCDEVLNSKASRQHRFDFLKGDAGTKLPVDAYYVEHKLVVEYMEKQHTEEVKFFDKRQTVSGISRGEQRKKYDKLRQVEIPKNGYRLIIFSYDEFAHSKSKKLIRNRIEDLKVIKIKLNN